MSPLIRIHNLKTDLDDDQELLKARAAERLGLPADSIEEFRIARRSLDARHKKRIRWVYTVDAGVPDAEVVAKRAGLAIAGEQNPLEGLQHGQETLPERPVVVGCGPAGIFAAYLLSLYGYSPLVLERGGAVRERVQDVQRLWKGGEHNPESNLLFGEGGAGTFSDGKLTCRTSSPLISSILQIMVENRAPENLLYEARPHIGTDRLRAVLVTLRKRMVEMGVEFRFNARMDDLRIENGALTGLQVGEELIQTGPVLLGTGHSARDTYEMLRTRGVNMEFKPFQFGMRVEHPQELIDRDQYGDAFGHQNLGPAEYILVRDKNRKRRPVFSFCMCPGGVVLPSISEPEALCTNGMSNHKRNSGLANGGLVMTIGEREVSGSDPLRGVEFQRLYERKAFILGGSDYTAPAQSIPDFVRGIQSGRTFETTYPNGYVEADLREMIPSSAARAIASTLKEFDRKLPGFGSDRGTITGPESRGSSPVRIVRDPDSFESISVKNLYPIGEGAGYAGGIISAALDGMKTAIAIIRRYASPGK